MFKPRIIRGLNLEVGERWKESQRVPELGIRRGDVVAEPKAAILAIHQTQCLQPIHLDAMWRRH